MKNNSEKPVNESHSFPDVNGRYENKMSKSEFSFSGPLPDIDYHCMVKMKYIVEVISWGTFPFEVNYLYFREIIVIISGF